MKAKNVGCPYQLNPTQSSTLSRTLVESVRWTATSRTEAGIGWFVAEFSNYESPVAIRALLSP